MATLAKACGSWRNEEDDLENNQANAERSTPNVE